MDVANKDIKSIGVTEEDAMLTDLLCGDAKGTNWNKKKNKSGPSLVIFVDYFIFMSSDLISFSFI